MLNTLFFELLMFLTFLGHHGDAFTIDIISPENGVAEAYVYRVEDYDWQFDLYSPQAETPYTFYAAFVDNGLYYITLEGENEGFYFDMADYMDVLDLWDDGFSDFRLIMESGDAVYFTSTELNHYIFLETDEVILTVNR